MKFVLVILLLISILVGSIVLSQIGYSNESDSTPVEQFDNKRPEFNTRIDAIYYINLDKREDRKKEFLDNFNEMDESRITRVKGHHYPDNGAVGCLMSHITALSLASKSNAGENILICEDDFTIKDMDYCNRMLDLVFDKLPDWDVIMLGHNTIDSKDTSIESEKKEKVIQIINSQTASGYLIRKSYIPKLLDIYANDLTEYMNTGEWGNFFTDQSWKVLQPVDKWYAFEPSVGFQRPSYSDIQNGFISEEV